MKQLKKITLVCLTVLMSAIALTGCGSKEAKETTKVCKSAASYDVRYQYKFILDSDKKTIKEISFIQTVNEENIDKVYPDYDKKDTYLRFKNDMSNQYDKYVTGNEELSWFKSKFEVKEEDYYAQLAFVFDVANKDLDLKDNDTISFLQQFGVNMFYNNDEKAFLYDEERFLNNVPIKSIYKAECVNEKNE